MKIRHIKRDKTYEYLGLAEMQISRPETGQRKITETDCISIYREKAGKMWARFPDEMEDGRFEKAPRSKSYPLLALSREFAVPYGLVLRAADQYKALDPAKYGSKIQRLVNVPMLRELQGLLGAFEAGELLGEIAMVQEEVFGT